VGKQLFTAYILCIK